MDMDGKLKRRNFFLDFINNLWTRHFKFCLVVLEFIVVLRLLSGGCAVYGVKMRLKLTGLRYCVVLLLKFLVHVDLMELLRYGIDIEGH